MGFLGKMFGKNVQKGKAELAKVENRDLMQAIVGGALLVAYADGECEDAELAKLQGSLPADHEVDVLLPHLSTLVLQIRRNVQLFCSSSGNKELSRLVLTGGGSLLPGLAGQIGSELNCEVLHPDPFALFGKPQGEGGLTHGAKYMTALGLALRSFTPCQI